MKEAVVSAISNIADVAGEDMRPFYDEAVAFLHKMLDSHQQREYAELRGHILECLSMLAVAVGQQCF